MSERAADDLPPQLRAFLYSCTDAIEQVEILVRLHAGARFATVRTLAAEMGLSDAVTRHHLETLAARGLLQISIGEEISYRFAPKSAELQRYCELLVEHYSHSRDAVLRFVAASQRRSMKKFSDAFKLRDPEK